MPVLPAHLSSGSRTRNRLNTPAIPRWHRTGKGGFTAYDVASIANKGTSERILKGPFSALGHDTNVKTTNATCMAIGTNQPISIELIRESLKDLLALQDKLVSVDNIQRTVAERYDIRMSEMLGRGRPKAIAEARQVAMYLARTHLGATRR